MVVRWIFFDPTDSTTQVFEVNPNEGGTQSYSKNITQSNTLTPAGRTLAFEGSKQTPEISFSGVILTETMLNLIITWFNKTHQILLTDDLGREMMIYITKFEPKRVRKPQIPFYHTYTVTALILDWPT